MGTVLGVSKSDLPPLENVSTSSTSGSPPAYTGPTTDNSHVLYDLMQLIVLLTQTVQNLAVSVSNKMNNLTQTIDNYTTFQNEFQLLTPQNTSQTGWTASTLASYNSAISQTLNAVKANAQVDQDKAQQYQTLLQNANNFQQNDLTANFDSILQMVNDLSAKLSR